MITFQNRGLIDARGLTAFGVCVKPESDNPIGYFGTGLKYAIAVLLRNKCKVTLHRGLEQFKFTICQKKMRDREVPMVYMGTAELPFTAELGKNWDLWMAYRELAANAFDEPENDVHSDSYKPKEDTTAFVVEGDEIDTIHKEHNRIFLNTEPKYKLNGLEVHDGLDTGGWIYYRGIRVYKLEKQAMYNYNLTTHTQLTEDRTLTTLSEFFMVFAKAISQCDEPALIRQLLLADQRFFESTIDYNWWHFTAGKVFNTIVGGYIGGHTSFNSSARDLYRRAHPKDEPPITIALEELPMAQRRKLWAALRFWRKLDLEIPRSIIHVAKDLKKQKGTVVNSHIYLSQHVLEMDMRFITGYVYKLYSQSKPTIGDIRQEDLLIDTIVDFGERLLGLSEEAA